MKSDFQLVKLRGVLDVVIDNRGRNPESYSDSGIPVIDNFLIISEAEVDLSQVKRYLDKDTYNTFIRKYISKGDVLMTLVGNGYGNVAITPEQRCIIVQNTIGLRCNENNDNLYLYYLLKANRENLMNLNRGAAQPSIKVGDILDLDFKFPPLDIQQKIGSVLGDLDKKSSINRQINQTLEAMVQAIFNSWFVDFDPVKAKIAAIEAGQDPLRAAMSAISGKTDAELDAMPRPQYDELAATAALFPEELEESELGDVPKGWDVSPMTDVIEINPKRQLKKGEIVPYLDMANIPTNSSRAQNVVLREFSSGSKFMNGDTLLARITPCLENGKTAFVDFLADKQVGWGSTEFIVLRSKHELPIEFAYLLCRHPDFRAFAIAQMVGTSGRQRVPNDCFSKYLITVPSAGVAMAFGLVSKSIMCQIKARDEEVKTLSELRDTLLPKLLSGELSVDISQPQQDASHD